MRPDKVYGMRQTTTMGFLGEGAEHMNEAGQRAQESGRTALRRKSAWSSHACSAAQVF